MKKVLSILLSVLMVMGSFVTLTPMTSAKPVSMAELGTLVYSEDFEGDHLTDKTDRTLTQALGWTQWADVENDASTSYNDGYAQGLNGRGTASIVTDEISGNKGIQMKYVGTSDKASKGTSGDSYGWATEIVNDEALIGADYIIEYTLTINENTANSNQGIGFRNNRCWGYKSALVGSGDDMLSSSDAMGYQIHIKHNGQNDMHLMAKSSTAIKTKEASSWGTLTSIENIAATGKSDILGLTHTFRTVVSATEGVHTYVKSNDGSWIYYFGMSEESVSKFSENKDLIGSGLILRICQGVTATLDDISVYTIGTTVNLDGFQTTVEENGRYDLRLIGSVSDQTNVVSAGFIIRVNGGPERTVYVEYVYQEITTDYGKKSYQAPQNGFLAALSITDCPVDTQFSVKFFVKYENGETIVGEEKSIIYQENNILDGLDGKKIIFMGDSFIFWGQVVLEESESRYNDQGYFYQLCKTMGAEVSVTNWTYPGRDIHYIYENYMNNLTDRYYDYVVVSGGRNSASKAEDYFTTLQAYMDLFEAVNPNVKFVYLVSSGAHNISVEETFPVDLLNNLDEFEKMGITIVDWGKLVSDVIRQNVAVPNAEKTYTKNTFIVDRSSEDGFHPNQLSGYITALMTYCAITGESAVGTSYDFWNDSAIDSRFDSDSYVSKNYKNGTTNYPEIFASPADMEGLQTLIDQYLEEKAYREYQFSVQ